VRLCVKRAVLQKLGSTSLDHESGATFNKVGRGHMFDFFG